jgi:hypothetical protein
MSRSRRPIRQIRIGDEKVAEYGVARAVSGSFDYGGKSAAFAQDDDFLIRGDRCRFCGASSFEVSTRAIGLRHSASDRERHKQIPAG